MIDTDTDASRTEATLRQLMADRAAAMRSRNADYLASRYAAGAVTFDLAPPLQSASSGVAQDADARRAWFAGFDGEIDFEIRDLAVLGDGDIAVCRSLNRLAATPKGMTEAFQLWFRATVCWRRSNDGWQIVHEHNSTPFYMDGSLRAAVDLTP
jgi:ketosteroid isomerase-like protein